MLNGVEMTLNRTLLLAGLSALVFTACKADEECQYAPPEAVISAEDITYAINQEVSISGLDSDASCNRDFTFTWNWERVPVGSQLTDTFSDNGTSRGGEQTQFFDAVGDYVLRLVVFDGVQQSTESLMVFQVVADNLPPEASAGDDRAGSVGERVSLDGTESYDPELEELEYRWTLKDKPADSQLDDSAIYDADEASAHFIPDVPGAFVFGLVVSDGFAWSAPDYVGLIVENDNLPPIAEANDPTKPDDVLTPCESADPVLLNGSRSYDPEGQDLEYDWGVVSVPAGSAADVTGFSDTASARPTFATDDTYGAYTFELRVHDGELWSAWDEVSITTTDPVLNAFPTANAGADVKIDVEARCYSYRGEWRCGECPVPTFSLDGTLSADPDGDTLSYLWHVTKGEGLNLSHSEGPIISAVPSVTTVEYGKTVTRTWELNMSAADCGGEASDTVQLTMTCKGDDK
ncbi:MAG: hypothetical protein ACI9MC_002565 [Kiritimatiellia bacterium]|jgi:hypothetical protein